MARIRTIKPEFWTDEKIVELRPFARLLFLGMLNFSDDEGRMVYSPRRIKMQVLPADDVDIEVLVAEIRALGIVAVYELDGVKYLQINNFKRHQKNEKFTASKLPAPTSGNPLPVAEIRLGKERKGKEGNGKEKNKTLSVAIAPVDERKAAIREAIKKGYAWRNENRECPWGVAEETILKRVLLEVPRSYTAEFFVECIRNKFRSDEAHSPLPREWLKFILTYADGPIDRFRKPKSLGESNGRKAQISQDQQRDDFRQMAAAIDGESDCETTVPKQHLLPDAGAKARSDGGLVEIGKAARAGKIY